MTPVFCCGGECGVFGSGLHFADGSLGTAPTFDTTTKRNGSRSIRFNPSSSASSANAQGLATTTFKVWRFYVNFTTLPSADTLIAWSSYGTDFQGVSFRQSDSSIYAANRIGGVVGPGLSGVAITTGVWYRIDVINNGDVGGGQGAVDVQVDGVACGQKTTAFGVTTTAVVNFGIRDTCSADMYIDDILISDTDTDYPLGAGYVNHFVPTSDGSHNVAGANDFEIGTGGVDITNATTTAWQLVDDVPLQSGAIGTTDFINMVAPANATDYVECIFGPASGISTPTTGPRTVEVIVGVAAASSLACNMEVRLNDNGTMGTVYTQTGGTTLSTTISHKRANFTDPPSAASVWNANNDGSNGDFRDLRVRFGSPAALDVNPDPYFASIMIEAEFAEVVNTRIPRPISIGHPFIF